MQRSNDLKSDSFKTHLHFSYNESIIRSELIWALYIVSKSLSHSKCDNIKASLNEMFPRTKPETFSVNFSKISYLISEAVGPYFNTLNIGDVKKSSSSATIHYDETNNKPAKTQLGIKMFWSETDSAFKVHHLKTYLHI